MTRFFPPPPHHHQEVQRKCRPGESSGCCPLAKDSSRRRRRRHFVEAAAAASAAVRTACSSGNFPARFKSGVINNPRRRRRVLLSRSRRKNISEMFIARVAPLLSVPRGLCTREFENLTSKLRCCRRRLHHNSPLSLKSLLSLPLLCTRTVDLVERVFVR